MGAHPDVTAMAVTVRVPDAPAGAGAPVPHLVKKEGQFIFYVWALSWLFMPYAHCGMEFHSHSSTNPGNNLHVSGLSHKVDTRDLEAAFSKIGRVSPHFNAWNFV